MTGLSGDDKEEESPPVPDDGLEKALDEIGNLNCWMWMVFFMTSIGGVFNIWHLTAYVFLGAELDYWCEIPELKAANWTEEQIRNITTGSHTGKSCTAPAYNYSYLASLPFEDALMEETPSTKWTCINFDYHDEGTSIVSEWDLVCDRLFLRSTTQMVVSLGRFTGALLFGLVADKWGRKRSLIIAYAMYIISGPLAAVPIYWVFVVCRFFLGLAGSACFNCAFTLLTEVLNAKHRTMMGILYNMSYPLGMLLLALIAYFVPQWQSLQLAISVPTLLLLICYWFLPESPRWLISQGRREEAWAVVRRANKKLAPIPATPMIFCNGNIETKVSDSVIEAPKETPEPLMKRFMASFRKLGSLVSKGELLKRLLICQYMWCITAMTYYSLSLSSDNFTADRYIYIAIAGAVEAVSYILPIFILRWVGRRPTTAVMYLVSGVALLSIMAVPRDDTATIMGVAMVGRLCIGAVYSVIILYTSELFPTVNRNTAVGSSSTMSHVGSMASPYIVDLLGAVQWFIPSTICAVLSLIAGLLVLLLPETKGKELCNTVEEMEAKAKKGDTVSFRNCCSCD